jgi:hypothetical protein
MNLTPEQLEQCRAEFEEMWRSRGYSLGERRPGGYRNKSADDAFEGFSAAWRPIPSVDEIDGILRRNGGHIPAAGSYYFTCDPSKSSQEIRRAFGGKE